MSDTITNEIITTLTSRDSQPVFLFDKEVFANNINALKDAMNKRFGERFIIGYSVKTNPHPEVVSAALENGCFVECVSKEEVLLSLKSHATIDKVIWNGPLPCFTTKSNALAHGAIVNIDNAEEFRWTTALLAELENIKVNVGIRVSTECLGQESRFGIVPGSEEWEEVFAIAAENKSININGLHIHTGYSESRKLDEFKRKVDIMCKLAREHGVEYIDFGGHIFGPNDKRFQRYLEKRFNCKLPTFDDYAECIYQSLKQEYGDEQFPVVILEPGTALISNAVDCLAKVRNVKEKDGTRKVTVEVSRFDFGFIGSSGQIPFDVASLIPFDSIEEMLIGRKRFAWPTQRVRPGTYMKIISRFNMNTVVYGSSCCEDDILSEAVCDQIDVGDYLLFRNVGAYTYSFGNDFIKPKVEMICYGK